TGLVVKQLLNRASVHFFLIQQKENHTGVQRSAAGPHRKAIESRETHSARHALARRHGAHTGAVAKMHNDCFSSGGTRSAFRKDGGDVFVGESMKSIATHARVSQLLR